MMTILLEAACKSIAVGVVALLVCRLLHRPPAAARHLICLTALVAIAISPGLCAALRLLPLPMISLPAARPISPTKPVSPPATTKGKAATPQKTARTPTASPVALPVLKERTNYQVVLIGAWLLGTTACLIPWVAGLMQVKHLRQRSAPAEARLSWIGTSAAQAMGCAEPVPVLLSPLVSVPLTFGLRRPIVLLPTEAANWSDERIQAALLHEMAHVARQDFLTQAVIGLICAMYWFHPLVWLLAHRVRVEAEAACDARVVSGGVAPGAYAQHLLEIACGLSRISVPRAAAAIVRTPRLERRITMILDQTPRRVSRGQFLAAACSGVCLMGLIILRVGGANALPPGWKPPMPAAPASDPAAVEFLRQSMDKYAGLQTFRADVDYVMSFSDTGPLDAQPLDHPADYQRTIAYAAPNRFRVTATTYKTLKHIYISDGKRMVILKEGYDQAPEHFEAPDSFAVADKNNLSHPHFGGSALYRFFAGRDGYDRLIDAETAWSIQKEKPQAVRFGPDVTLNGEPCKTVIFGGGLYDDERRAIIGKQDHLVRRMEYREQGRAYTRAEIAQQVEEVKQRNYPPEARKSALYLAKRARLPYALSVEYYKNVVADGTVADSEFVVPKTD